jgi:subtilase family serine protease
LIVESVTLSPNNLTVGQLVDVTIRIRNQGAAPVETSFYVDFYADDQPIGCQDWGSMFWTVESLPAGATQDLTFTYPGFGTAGTHTVWAFVDSGCQITESNETNNMFSVTTAYRVHLPAIQK